MYTNFFLKLIRDTAIINHQSSLYFSHDATQLLSANFQVSGFPQSTPKAFPFPALEYR